MSLNNEIGKINAIISRNSDWEQIVNALERLQSLSSPASFRTISPQNTADLRSGIEKLLKDTRSKVTKSTYSTIKYMACTLKKSFSCIAEGVFPLCLSKSSNKEVEEVCIVIVSNVIMKQHCITSILSYMEKRSEKVSFTAIQCLGIVLKQWPFDSFSRLQDNIVGSLRRALGSGYQSVRNIAKQIISSTVDQYPSMEPLFRKELPPSEIYLLGRECCKTSFSSYKDKGTLYSIDQSVLCHLSTGDVHGVIKYIGTPLSSDSIRFGIVFNQRVDSQFKGEVNGIRLFDCEQGYGALVPSSYIEPISSTPLLARYPKRPSKLTNNSVSPKPSSSNGMFYSKSTAPSPVFSKGMDTINSKPLYSEKNVSIDDCMASHKLMINNFIECFKVELKILEDLEPNKANPEAVEAYRAEMKNLIEKRKAEENEFISKLARLSV